MPRWPNHTVAVRIVSSVQRLQHLARGWRRQGQAVGLVPTMGFLHEGHLGLAAAARRKVGRKGIVVLSIYVNPTQFGPREDLGRYPRDLKRDSRLCRAAGVNVLFTPSDDSMYPGREDGVYSTYVIEESLSRGMESNSRPTHFRGVTTVVAKLFNIVLPDVAVFGAKDYQQAAVVRRMAADLNFPVRIIVAPTRREPDGLAMSSRNKYLIGGLRKQAAVLWKAIQAARATVRASRAPLPSRSLRERMRRMIEQEPEARVDYIEFFDSSSLAPVPRAVAGARVAVAVNIGGTRLIDNASL